MILIKKQKPRISPELLQTPKTYNYEKHAPFGANKVKTSL
jgi:hypothetical protein